MINAGQELFDRLYYYSQEKLKYDTYDMLPTIDASYPFVHFGMVEEDYSSLKDNHTGKVSQIINVWGTVDMRAEVSMMMNALIFDRVKTKNYTFTLVNKQTQLISDSSVENTRLIHGILTLDFNYFES